VTVTQRCQSRAICRVSRDRLFKQVERLPPLPLQAKVHCKRPQIGVIGNSDRLAGDPPSGRFGCLQSRLDDARNSGRDPLLHVKDVFHCAVEAVGSEMRAAARVDSFVGFGFERCRSSSAAMAPGRTCRPSRRSTASLKRFATSRSRHSRIALEAGLPSALIF